MAKRIKKLNDEETENIEFLDTEDGEDDEGLGIDVKSFTRLLTHRSIYLFGIVNRQNILSVIAQIHFCETLSNKDDITLYINSEGGYIGDCFALIDVMDHCKCDISTVVLGTAASAACLIASNGTKGKRLAGRNAEFMYHESYGDLMDVSQSQLPYYVQQFTRTQKKLDQIFRRNTGKSMNEIRKKFLEKKLDKYMNSTEARDFGIIDKVLPSRRRSSK